MLAIVTGAVSTLGAVVKHEPNFYRQSQVPASEARVALANEFFNNFLQMIANINSQEKETWGCDATEAQLNSFFDEIWVKKGEAEGLRELGMSSPSVVLENDHVRLAFRYGSGWFSTVISYDLKIWLVPKEPNVIAVEIQSARAGALPISNRTILNQLTDFARKQNFKVNLFRHEGNTVAVIDLQGDQPRPKAVLTALEIQPNRLIIRGKTLEHAWRN
jgi:hypothetical protein